MEKVSIQLFDNKAETEKSKNKISLEEHKAWPSHTISHFTSLFDKYKSMKSSFIKANKSVTKCLKELQPSEISQSEFTSLASKYLNYELKDISQSVLIIDLKYQSHQIFIDNVKYCILPDLKEIRILSIDKWNKKIVNLFLENSLPK